MAQTEALLSELRRGSREAFETIFRTYYQQVFAVAYRLLGSAQEADDVAQEAFLRLYLHPLPAGREHNLAGWLMRVAANLGYNALRSRKRRAARESSPTDDGSGAEAFDRAHPAAQTSTATDDGTAERVREALAQLPERQAQLLLLRQAGLSYGELAAALGVAPGSVGTLLARAERAFQQLYGASEEIDHGSKG